MNDAIIIALVIINLQTRKEVSMGRSVKVKIGGREFASKKAAVDYFMDQREAVKGSGPLREGQFFDELLELYTRYCEVTNWELSNRVIYAFSVDYEPRKNGRPGIASLLLG
jgi:hypothetical protein